MTALLIVGAGGHGKVVADAALQSGWTTVAFLDDRARQLGSPLGLAIVGSTDDLPSQQSKFSSAIVAIGDPRRRIELLELCRACGFSLPTVIHPTASISRFVTIGAGSVVLAQAAINADAVLLAGCIVNTGATVDHDCNLGRGVHVCPGAHLAGGVSVGDFSTIGVGAAVREGISIGTGVIVGAGAAVVRDVSDGRTVIGVPAQLAGGVRE